MDITNAIHRAHHIDRQRQQFVPLGQDTISKALGSAQIEHIFQEEVGPRRLRKNLSHSLENQAARLCGWRRRSVKIFDATTVCMPDTPPNQQA